LFYQESYQKKTGAVSSPQWVKSHRPMLNEARLAHPYS
jgi:hypothetical protein